MFVKDPATVVDTTPTTFNIAMTAEEEAAQQENLLSQEELITKVEGTKISFGKALIDQLVMQSNIVYMGKFWNEEF